MRDLFSNFEAFKNDILNNNEIFKNDLFGGKILIKEKIIKEYKAWRSMKFRCSNINNKYYGGKGIDVCKRWKNNFLLFLFDVGLAPTPKHSIHRTSNNGNYEPGNVKWATKKEQMNNRQCHHIHRKKIFRGKPIKLLSNTLPERRWRILAKHKIYE